MAQKSKKIASGKIRCCGGCGRELASNAVNFFKSNKDEDIEKHYGFAPICKKCIKATIVDDYGRTNKVLFKRILEVLDVVFIPKLFNDAIIACNDDHTKVLGEYRSSLQLVQEYRPLRFVDSSRFEYLDIVEGREKTENRKQVTEEMMRFWGTEIKDPKLYLIYQEEFDRLVQEDGGEINSIKESYFKNISILRYTAEQQLLSNNLKDYDMTMKTLQAICEKCGINPKQVQDKSDANKGTFGVFIKKIEEEEPIFSPEEHLGSFDVVKRILQVFFFGHLAEVMNFKNPLKCKYDETMQEYTVRVDSYEDLANLEENIDSDIDLKKVKKVRTSLASKLRKKRLG